MKNLIQNIPNQESLTALLGFPPSTEFVQRSNRAQVLVSKSGRGLFLPLTILCGIGGIVLFIAAFTSGSTVVSLMAGTLILLAILAAIWFQPGLLATLIRNFSGAIHNHLQQASDHVHANRIAEQNRINQFISNWISENLAEGSSLNQILHELDDTAAQVEKRKEAVLAEIEEIAQLESQAQEKSEAEKKALAAAATRWSSRLFSGAARRASRRALSAIEGHAVFSMQLSLLRAKVAFLEHVSSSLAEARAHVASELVQPLLTLKDTTAAEILELELQEQTGFPLVTFKPSLQELSPVIVDAVQSRLGQIRHSLAHRVDGESAANALQHAVGDIIATTGVVPQSFSEYLSGCNGEASDILDRIDAESKGFSICDHTPGRSTCEFRYCLVAEGSNSSAFNSVKARSHGVPVRDINHTDPCDLIVADVEKFVPGAETVEFVHAALAFENAPKSVQSAIIFIAPSDDTILHYTPERAVDPDRGFRLLFLGLIWQEIIRTGSEEYRYTSASRKPLTIARGWEEAAHQLQTDKSLADQIESRIRRHRETEGETAATSRQKAAYESPGDLVPAAAVSKFREILDQELPRLNPARSALAA